MSDNIPARTVDGPIAAPDAVLSHEIRSREATGPRRVATSEPSRHAGGSEDVDPAAARLAEEIRRRRKAAGLSHAQLAVKTGYTRQYVSLAERPRKGLPSVDLVRALDRELDAGGALSALRKLAERARQVRRGRDSATEGRRHQRLQYPGRHPIQPSGSAKSWWRRRTQMIDSSMSS